MSFTNINPSNEILIMYTDNDSGGENIKPFQGFTPKPGIHNYGMMALVNESTSMMHMMCMQTHHQFCEPIPIPNTNDQEHIRQRAKIAYRAINRLN